MTFTLRLTCRGCEGTELVSVLDLGEQPLANGFRKPEDDSPEPRFPLHLVRCPSCELVQLTCVVEPTVLYGAHYPYRSGASDSWALHCHDLAKEIGKQKRVLEIGCLDGVMLRHCADNGCQVQGCDPSSPILEHPIRHELFDKDTKFDGYFDVIVAQNVFGHVDDARGFLTGIRNNLASDGQAIIECPWVVDMIDGVRWDTIYHEHLSYWGLRPLKRLAISVGLHVHDVRYFPDLHGGTMRYYLGHSPEVDPQVYETWRDEEMGELDWHRFQTRARQQVAEWCGFFITSGKDRIAAYGASAKLNVFLNALPHRPAIEAIYDDCAAKIGLLSPGWEFPIRPPTHGMADMDVLLIGSPNIKAELEEKARKFGFVGSVRSLWG